MGVAGGLGTPQSSEPVGRSGFGTVGPGGERGTALHLTQSRGCKDPSPPLPHMPTGARGSRWGESPRGAVSLGRLLGWRCEGPVGVPAPPPPSPQFAEAGALFIVKDPPSQEP